MTETSLVLWGRSDRGRGSVELRQALPRPPQRETPAAVRNDAANTYWFALKEHGPAGVATGVWEVTNLNGTGPVFAVDNVASVLTRLAAHP